MTNEVTDPATPKCITDDPVSHLLVCGLTRYCIILNVMSWIRLQQNLNMKSLRQEVILKNFLNSQFGLQEEMEIKKITKVCLNFDKIRIAVFYFVGIWSSIKRT